MPAEQKAILEQGFDGLITKPFKEADLIACINENSGEASKLDLSALLAMCMNDKELLQMSLDSFISETTQDLITLRQFAEQQDQNRMMELCHKLAGRIGQVGDMTLSIKLRKLEKTFKQPCDLQTETHELNLVLTEISDLIKAVEHYKEV